MSSALLVLERAVEVCARLERAGVVHGLGGALALAYHVQDARATADIDINVCFEPQDPESLYRLLPTDIPWGPAEIEAAQRDGQVAPHGGALPRCRSCSTNSCRSLSRVSPCSG